MKRGITLLEVMVVTVCMAVIVAATTSSVFTALNHTNRIKASRKSYDQNALFEDRVRLILQNAYLSSVTTDTGSYFYGGAGVLDSVTGGGTGQSSNQVQLVFTALSPRVPSELLNSTDDFATLNNSFGPEGGMTEYSLSLTPVGQAPVDQALFLRHQTPPDGDPTQGGMETILDPDITTINYQFYDGLEWVQAWDTQSISPPRLPAAVQISYRRKNDTVDKMFVVRLIHSDVTSDNPVTTAAQQ
jgi:Tfp pilus assembly protein PilE